MAYKYANIKNYLHGIAFNGRLAALQFGPAASNKRAGHDRLCLSSLMKLLAQLRKSP
jgi:hypothetical protein